MTPPGLSPVLSLVEGREPTSPETEVKTRVLAWCSAWSSVNGHFQTDQLREIASGGPVRMAADFGHRMAVNVTIDGYAAFWSPLLSQTFSDWSLMIDSPIDVRVFKNMATANFTTRLQGTAHDGRRLEQKQQTRQMMERVGGVWRLLQEQITIPAEAACL
jgi:hypothetical protein